MQSALVNAISGAAAASQRAAAAASNIASLRTSAVSPSPRAEASDDPPRRSEARAREGPRDEVSVDAETVRDDVAPEPRAPEAREPEARAPEAREPEARAPRAVDRPATEEVGYRPVRVEQVSVESGGVRTVERPPPARADDVTAPPPQVAPEREFGELILARRAYEASLKVAEQAARAISLDTLIKGEA